MPTGYTDMLDKNEDMTTTQWIMTGLARAFGVCAGLREDARNLSEQEIIERIKGFDEDRVKWHQDELDKAEKLLHSHVKMTKPQWEEVMKNKNESIETYNKKSIEDASRMKQRHDSVRNDLNYILEKPNLSETTRNIVKFGIDQLDRVEDYDCKPYVSPINTDVEAFKQKQIASYVKNIVYHKKERAKAEERGKERLETYLQLKKDIVRVK